MKLTRIIANLAGWRRSARRLFEGGTDSRPAGKELGTGDFSLNRWVELCCTNPAKFFGIYPQKGVIAPGNDADIVVWDSDATHTIRAASQHQRTDYNLYEGMKVTGMPSVVLSRGRVLVQDGEWKGEAGAGRFLRQRRFERPGAMPSKAAAARATAKAKVPAGSRGK